MSGPFQVTLTEDARYLAACHDDYSRRCHVVPLLHKSEATRAIRATINMWKNESDNRLKAVCTDRGIEQVNSELESYFSNKGVVHSTTAPYTT